MPTVKRFTPDNETVRALPGVQRSENAPIENFGGGAGTREVGAAAQDLGDFAFKVAEQAKIDADQLRILEADRDLSALETRIQYDPADGAMLKKGRDVFKLPDDVRKQWEEGTSKIEEGLSNPAQRAAFLGRKTARWASLDGNVQRYVGGEIQKYDDEVTTSFLATERDRAASNYMDPNIIGDSIDGQKQALALFAHRNGLPAEWIQVKISDAESKTHVSVLERMLANGQDLDASGYYEANKQGITGADAIAVEKALQEGTLRGESQRETDRIMQGKTDWKERFDAARSITDPKLRDEVDRRLKVEMQTQDSIESERREQNFQTASDIAEKAVDKDRIPPSIWMNLSLAQRNAVEARIEQLRSGIPAKTDWELYYEMKSLASTSATKDKFLRTNLLLHRNNLSDTEFKELTSLQASLRTGDESADKHLDGYRSNEIIVNDALTASGIDITPKAGNADSLKVAQFRRLVDENIAVHQARTQKKATNEEVQSIVDNLMIKGVTSNFGSGFLWLGATKKRAFELTPGEGIAIEKTDIPRAEIAKIEDALSRANLPVTDEKVIELYNRRLSTMTDGR